MTNQTEPAALHHETRHEPEHEIEHEAERELPRASRRFLHAALASIMVAALLEVVFVLAVDPYRLYRIWTHFGVNAIKPALTRYQNEIKLSHAIALAPDTVVMGNSRAEIGFDPDSAAFQAVHANAYNLAIPGVGIAVSEVQLRELAGANRLPKLIVLGVEFLDFLEIGKPFRDDTPAAGNYPANQLSKLTKWGWRFDALFSWTSLKDAIQTVRIPREPYAAVTTSRGFNPLHEYLKMAMESGYDMLFRQKAQGYASSYARFTKSGFYLGDLAPLRAILDDSGQSGIAVELIIYPYHAQMLVLFEEQVFGPRLRNGRRAWSRRSNRRGCGIRGLR